MVGHDFGLEDCPVREKYKSQNEGLQRHVSNADVTESSEFCERRLLRRRTDAELELEPSPLASTAPKRGSAAALALASRLSYDAPRSKEARIFPKVSSSSSVRAMAP